MDHGDPVSAELRGRRRRGDLAESGQQVEDRGTGGCAMSRRGERPRSAHRVTAGCLTFVGPDACRRGRRRPSEPPSELAKNSPETRPESLTSFRATNSSPEHGNRSTWKCALSAESCNAPERIRTSDLRFRRRTPIGLKHQYWRGIRLAALQPALQRFFAEAGRHGSRRVLRTSVDRNGRPSVLHSRGLRVASRAKWDVGQARASVAVVTTEVTT